MEVLYGENPPPIMMIGHSMGGAIAVHTAAANHLPSLLGLCVIDVVEGGSFYTLLIKIKKLYSAPPGHFPIFGVFDSCVMMMVGTTMNGCLSLLCVYLGVFKAQPWMR